jgi:DNA gyrase/topoisomerase IV subunit A
VIFATTRGTVRRNKLSDFTQVNRNGKIAMKLEDEGDGIVGVQTCTERRRHPPTTAQASASASRHDIGFQGRDSWACAAFAGQVRPRHSR